MLQRMTRNDPADQYPELVKPPSDEFVVRARRILAILALKADPPGTADELSMELQMLGLIPTPSPQRKSKVSATQGHREPGARPSTAKPGPFKAPSRSAMPAAKVDVNGARWCGAGEHPLPVGSGECIPCRNRRAKINRAKRKLTVEPPERPCKAGLHQMPAGLGRCKPCHNARNRARRAAEAAAKPPKPQTPRMCRPGKHVIPEGQDRCQECRVEYQREYRIQTKTGRIRKPRRHAVDPVKRKLAALARAQAVLDSAPTEPAAPVNEFGQALLRCASLRHHKPGPGDCMPCRKLRRAKLDVEHYERQLAELEAAA